LFVSLPFAGVFDLLFPLLGLDDDLSLLGDTGVASDGCCAGVASGVDCGDALLGLCGVELGALLSGWLPGVGAWIVDPPGAGGVFDDGGCAARDITSAA